MLPTSFACLSPVFRPLLPYFATFAIFLGVFLLCEVRTAKWEVDARCKLRSWCWEVANWLNVYNAKWEVHVIVHFGSGRRMEINDGRWEMEGRNDGVLSKCLLFTAFEYSCRYRVTEYICLFLSISLSICLSLSQTQLCALWAVDTECTETKVCWQSCSRHSD